MRDWNSRIEAFTLVDRAIRLQLADDHGELSEVEECLTRALELDSENIEALQEAAHLYDAVIPDPEKAQGYARLCRAKAVKIAAEMDEILTQRE